MRLKLLALLTFFSFLIQISFSIYYSSKIVDQNLLINHLENRLSQYSLQNQQLENQLAALNSLSRIASPSSLQSLTPIVNFLNLDQ